MADSTSGRQGRSSALADGTGHPTARWPGGPAGGAPGTAPCCRPRVSHEPTCGGGRPARHQKKEPQAVRTAAESVTTLKRRELIHHEAVVTWSGAGERTSPPPLLLYLVEWRPQRLLTLFHVPSGLHVSGSPGIRCQICCFLRFFYSYKNIF